ncbi:hypothetical protein D0437_27250, partial [Bacillus cereus]
MFYNTYYNKTVPKCVCFLGTFQKCIFEVLKLIFHEISTVLKKRLSHRVLAVDRKVAIRIHQSEANFGF